jgi:hypothetical protein
MSHTPGPWFVEFSSTLGNRIVHGEMSKSGFRDDVPMDPGDAEAVDNLTLAAAAPQMIEALKKSLALGNIGFQIGVAEMRGHEKIQERCGRQQDEIESLIRAAIAAAEGGAK